jgi:outer membrane protein OmpA-like peptidoglycan-associated protein
MKAVVAARVLCLALLLVTTAAVSATAATAIPLVQGLTLVRAASERQGDYESTLTIDSLDEQGILHLNVSADLPDPSGGKARAVTFNRDVSADDREHARTYKYLFSMGAEEYPGTTAMGVSGDVIRDLRTIGKASVTLDGQLGGLAGLLGGILEGVAGGGDPNKPGQSYLSASGTIHVVEKTPVPYPIIVNDAVVSLFAWHVKGEFAQDGAPVPVEGYILDDPANAVTLRCAFGKDRMDTTRISFPTESPVKSLETALAKEHRAVIYGIYFDFNSAAIKPRSTAVLHTIADVMKKNADWVLTIEGHTDNIGGDAANQDLSSRRAAAVRAALILLDIPAQRLLASGFGASVPRDTNATLAGRARNRRVELTRQ